jgi:hypothetical protein
VRLLLGHKADVGAKDNDGRLRIGTRQRCGCCWGTRRMSAQRITMDGQCSPGRLRLGTSQRCATQGECRREIL